MPDASADDTSAGAAEQTPKDDETLIERAERRTGKTAQELLTLLVLSLTAVLTAWCGFEASKWGGEMSISFSQASSARIQAAAAEGEANTARQFDLTIYASWIEAVAKKNTELADYIEARFTPAFKIAFDDWQAHDRALSSPFKEPSYVPPGTAEQKTLTARADAKFQQALTDNARGDQYSLLTVLFALVLFFTAMSAREFAPWVSRTLLGAGAVMMVVGIGILTTYPVLV